MEKTLGLESIISTTTLTNWFRGDYTSLEASAKAKEDNTILKFLYFITGFNNSTTEDNSLHTHGKEQGELACSCVKTKLMNLLKPPAQIVAKGSAESTYNTNCISTPLPRWILNSRHRKLLPLHSSQENKRNCWVGRKHTNCTQLVLDKPAADRIHFYNLLLVLRPSKTVRAAATDSAPR